MEKTGALAPVVSWMLGRDRSSLGRLVVPTTAVSSFINNTPVVAMLIPQVEAWSRARGASAFRYLMPLSFAAITGGAVTLMGTATHIVASGLLESIGEAPLGFFEITWVGLPIALLAVPLLVILAPRLLPERRSARTSAEDEVWEFVVDMVVSDGAGEVHAPTARLQPGDRPGRLSGWRLSPFGGPAHPGGTARDPGRRPHAMVDLVDGY